MRQNAESRSESPFDAVLGECLGALLAGADVEYCLRRWPEYAAELEPLLHTAAEVQQTPPLTLSDAGFERGRQRVRDAAAALRNGRDVPVPHDVPSSTRGHVPMDDWPAPPPQTEPVQRSINWFEALALAAAGAALVILLIFSAPPDSPLYPLRSSAQRALAWLQGTPEPAEVVAPRMTSSPTLTGTPIPVETSTSPAAVTATPSPRLTAETSPAEVTPAAQEPSVAETPAVAPSTLQLPPPISTPTQAPTFTATPVVTPTPTSMPVPTSTATRIPMETPRPTATPTETPRPADTPVPTATATPVPTDTLTPLPSPTPVPAQTPTVAPTRTRVPTALPTATAPATSELPDLRLVDETQLTRREYAVARAWSPDGERILFTVPRPPEAGGDWGIWVMKRDGSEQRELAAGRWPTFSPDGQHVAYVAGAGNDRSVWVVPVLGGEPQQVAGEATGRVFWPAGDTLLYATAEGLKAVRLTPAEVPVGAPELRVPLAGLIEEDPGWVQWSVAPDGGAVLVGTPSNWWLVRLEPGEVPQLLPVHSIWSETWTRDGTALALDGQGEFLTKGIYLLGANGRSGPRLLVSQWELGDRTGGIIRSLNWSPEGRWLLVEWSSGSMRDPSRLYLVDRAGNHRLLASLDGREILHWSPDGEWMAFHRAGNVWVARVAVNPSTSSGRRGLASP